MDKQEAARLILQPTPPPGPTRRPRKRPRSPDGRLLTWRSPLLKERLQAAETQDARCRPHNSPVHDPAQQGQHSKQGRRRGRTRTRSRPLFPVERKRPRFPWCPPPLLRRPRAPASRAAPTGGCHLAGSGPCVRYASAGLRPPPPPPLAALAPRATCSRGRRCPPTCGWSLKGAARRRLVPRGRCPPTCDWSLEDALRAHVAASRPCQRW